MGNIIIQRYNKLSSDDKNEIFRSTVSAIHMQKLLLPSDDISKQELVGFVQTHFPQAWEKVLKMSKEEVENDMRMKSIDR